MIIFLNTTVEQISTENQDEIDLLFSELLRASQLGLHLILINRRVCNWALDNLSLNNREKAHLAHIKSSFTQNGSLLDVAKSILYIEVGGFQLTEREPHKYYIGITSFLRGDYLSAPGLLVEHIENDGDLLKLIFSEMRRRHSVKNFNLQLLHGGGADITACLRTELSNQRIVVSIVDSDKVAPCDSSSATKNNLVREASRQTFIGMVCETPGKEIENFVPFEILYEHRRRICPNYTCFNTLENLLTRENIRAPLDSLWLFFDIKKGIEADKLNGLCNPTVQTWLQDKYHLDTPSFDELNIHGFGEAILRQFLNCGEAIKQFVKFVKTEYWAQHFHEFFDLVYWYFASEPKKRLG